jgi:hypothetical protein
MMHFASNRFVISNFDLSILMYKIEAFFITIYIDDITLYSPGSPILKKVNNILNFDFEVVDLENLQWLLGIQIKFGNKDID